MKMDFNNRRTIRQYTTDEIPMSEIREMIEIASHAPTTGNMQLYSVVITRDQAMKAKLALAHFNQPQVMSCDTLLTFCADFNRFVKWCEARDAQPGYDNLQSFITACIDTVAFAQQFCAVAESRGYGCCYLGTTTYNAPDIAKILELPTRVVPLTTLSVGVPANDGVDVGRLPVEAVMHVEKYNDYSLEDINMLFAEKEAREDSNQFVKENSKETLAQVFTDVRYTRDANEHFSDVFLEFLKQFYPFEKK